MKTPFDLSKGVKKYMEFHELEPTKVGAFAKGFKIPKIAYHVGDATHTAYQSSKWEDKMHDYWHDHESNVHVHLMDPNCGDPQDIPEFIRDATTLVCLGQLLEFGYVDNEGEFIEARISGKKPDLFCTPDGHALLIIESYKKLHAIIWGGHLRVEADGIDG